MRYFITLLYKGTAYSGWQTQPDAPTVQETIERALTLVSRSPEPISIVGAGRTDAGVHARAMVAHVDLDLSPEEAEELRFRTDRYLPHDSPYAASSPSARTHMPASALQPAPIAII